MFFLGGLGEEVLGDKLQIVEFTDMKHGWTVRQEFSWSFNKYYFKENRAFV